MQEDAAARHREADAFLRQTSWDGTWRRIRLLVDALLAPADGRSDAAASGLAG